ncbi:MAG TPA: DUF4403 family protein [Byssovorax sp.]
MRHDLSLLAAAAVVVSCSAFGGAVYPPRPPAAPGEPIADPSPSRVVLHTTVTAAALKSQLEHTIPRASDGTFPFMGSERTFTWERGPATVRFDRGRLVIEMHVDAKADMPISSLDLPLDIKIQAEPVVSSDYVAKLQSVEVAVTSTSTTIRFADAVAGVLEKIKKQLDGKLTGFSYDLGPTMAEAHERLSAPIDLPLGDAHGCAVVKVLGVEAGPTVLADGIEKDVAMVVQPSVLIPCPESPEKSPLPRLSNVATIQPGPFTVTIPVAANYDELAKAMSLTFTDGKLFFSKEHKDLFLEKPEIYAAKDQLVLKLHIGGAVHTPIELAMDGDLFMSGHPVVEDNELKIPDLEPTIETSSWLVKMKQAFDGSTMRDQARAALHLDIGARLAPVKEKLSKDLSFGSGVGCVRAATDKIEIGGVHVHQNYLRVYVNVTAHASIFMPCPR